MLLIAVIYIALGLFNAAVDSGDFLWFGLPLLTVGLMLLPATVVHLIRKTT